MVGQKWNPRQFPDSFQAMDSDRAVPHCRQDTNFQGRGINNKMPSPQVIALDSEDPVSNVPAALRRTFAMVCNGPASVKHFGIEQPYWLLQPTTLVCCSQTEHSNENKRNPPQTPKTSQRERSRGLTGAVGGGPLNKLGAPLPAAVRAAQNLASGAVCSRNIFSGLVILDYHC